MADCLTGLVLLGRPASIAALAAGGGPRPPAGVVRLLGVRFVAQGAAQLRQPAKGTTRLVAAVELAHGASMAGLAVVSPRYRRPALIALALAGASLAIEVAGA
jgi:hypothetical protein